MMDLGKWAFGNRLLVYFLVGVLIVGGAFSCYEMSKLEDPEVKVKLAMVVTTYPGASAHQVEMEVTDVLEKEIRTMGDLDNVESFSYNDLSIIQVELRSTIGNKEVEQCWDRLRRKVHDAQAALPAGASTSVTKDDFSAVYGMFYALTGDGLSQHELANYAELVKREVAGVSGVDRVEIYGRQQECIDIRLLQDKMSSLGVLPTEVLSTLNGQNKTSYAGYYDGGDQRVRVTVADRFQRVEDIRRMVIQGHETDQLRLADIAQVEKSTERPVRAALTYDGEQALGILVAASTGADIVKVGYAVDKRIDQLRHERFPTGVCCHKVFFQPERVTASLGTFVLNLIESVAIVVVILMIFMGFRSGLIIGASLVVIVFGSFLVLGTADGTMQRVSLGTFILAMGMLVDNAIVIVDGVLVDLKAGKPRMEALTGIGRRTAMPLLGATLIAILSFMPIFMSPDTAGIYVRDLFIVMAVSLLLSWVLALTHVPLMAGRMLFAGDGKSEEGAEKPTPYSSRSYAVLRRMLCFCLGHRWSVVAAMLVLMALAVVGYPYMHHGFFPDMVYDQCYMEYKLPEGTNSTRVERDLREIEAYLHSRAEVRHVTASIGGTPGRYNLVRTIATPSLSYGELIIDFTSPEALDANIEDIQTYLTEHYPDAYVKMKKYNLMFKKYPIELQFQGPDPAVLHTLADSARAVMERSGLVRLITTNWEPKVPVLQVDYDQASARSIGLSRSDLSISLLTAGGGIPVGCFYDGIYPNKIYVKCVDEAGRPVENLEDLQVFSAMPSLSGIVSEENMLRLKTGNLTRQELLGDVLHTTPLRQVSRQVTVGWEDPVVPRFDGQRMQRVQCSPLPGGETEKTRARLAQEIEKMTLPAGYSLSWQGEKAASDRSIKYLFANFPLAIIVIIAVLIMLFGDFRKPAIIFCLIPLVFVGVVMTLLLTGKTFTFVAIVGALGLIGMIVKNGIVLMDEITLQLSQGVEPLQALIDSSMSRLRPVMMASLTTVLGMIPLLTDAMFGSMAVTIMGGLLFGTLLTLIVIPVLYSLFYGIKPSCQPSPQRGGKLPTACLLLLLALMPCGAGAQTLTIQQCREQALQHNKERRAAALSTEAADYGRKSVRAQFLPNFSLMGFGLYDAGKGTFSYDLSGLKAPLAQSILSGVQAGAIGLQQAQWLGQLAQQVPGAMDVLDYKLGWMYGGALVVRQPLYMGGKIRAAYRASCLAVSLYQSGERMTEAQVIQQADEAYAKVVNAQELQLVAEKYKALLTELEANVASAVQHGLRMPADHMKVQVKLGEVELQLRRAQNGVRLAKMNLCHVVGLPLTAQVEVDGGFPAVEDAQMLQSMDVSARPEYAMLEAQTQIEAQRVRMARGEMLPQVALLAKYGYTHGLRLNDQPFLDSWDFAGGVTVSVPLFHFGEHTNKVKTAKAKLEQSQLERDNKQELMLLELTQAANNLDEAHLEVSLTESALAQADVHMTMSKSQCDAGLMPLSDYLEAQALWQQAYERQVAARFQRYLSSVAYLRAAGLLVR